MKPEVGFGAGSDKFSKLTFYDAEIWVKRHPSSYDLEKIETPHVNYDRAKEWIRKTGEVLNVQRSVITKRTLEEIYIKEVDRKEYLEREKIGG